MKSLLLLLFFPSVLWASIQMPYHPGSALKLGGGVDTDLPFDLKENCIQYAGVNWAHVDQGAMKLELKSGLVKTREDLFHSLKIDAKISAKAKFKIISGNASYEYKLAKSYQGLEDTLNYLVQAYYDFGLKELSDYSLKPAYQKLLDEGKYSEFKKRCGTHFAVASNQIVSVSMLLSAKNLNHTEIKDLSHHFTASVSATALSADAKANLARNYKLASSYGKTELKLDSIGGDPKVFNGFGNTTDITKALESLEKFLSGVRKETSAPVNFLLMPFENFGLPRVELDEALDAFLEKAYYRSLDLEERLAKISSELKAFSAFESRYNRELKIAQYQILRDLRDLDRLVQNCREFGDCNLEDLNFEGPILPFFTDSLQEHHLAAIRHGKRAQVVLSGKLIDMDLVANVSIERQFEDLSTGEQSWQSFDLARDVSTGRFVGVIDEVEFDSSRDLARFLSQARYIVKVTDLNHRTETYQLRITNN